MMKDIRCTSQGITRGIARVLFLAGLATLSVSCEKEKDIPLGTIEITINGDRKSFSSSSVAEWLTVEGGYGLKIHGFKGTAGSSNEMILSVASSSPIGPRTYSGSIGTSIATLQYNIYMLFFIDEYTSSSASVTITEIDASHAKGTFRGTLNGTGGSPGFTLTDGVFNVSF